MGEKIHLYVFVGMTTVSGTYMYEQSKFEVSNQIHAKLLLSRKLLQRKLFLTMFYTINLSPLLVIKKGFMIIIILSNYQ